MDDGTAGKLSLVHTWMLEHLIFLRLESANVYFLVPSMHRGFGFDAVLESSSLSISFVLPVSMSG